MRPHDILPKEAKTKNHPTPPSVDNEILRSIVDWLWPKEDDGADRPSMNEEEYRVRAERMNEYKKLAHAHIILLNNYATSDNPRLHKKAHTHFNEVKLLKQKVEYSYQLLSLFKKPTPPFNYHLASILGDAPFWRGVDELIKAYTSESEEASQKKDTHPTDAH